MVALASAFIRLRAEPDKAAFTKAGKEMGDAAGKAAGDSFGQGYTRGADGKLRDSRGKFVKDSEAMGGLAGGKAGDGFASGFGKGSGKIKDAIKSNLSLAAGVFVPLGLAAAVGQIAKIGIAYEDNLNIFKSVTKATGQEMDAVADKARQLGSDISLPGVSAAGAASAMTELAKAGFSVQESMDAAKGTLQLARIANINEGEAAEIAANAVNAFGIKAKDTTFVVDELAAAANSSSIEVTDASQAFKQAAAVFSGLQGPAVGGKEAITELNTAIAILGNNGIKGSDAGTSLKQALLQLTAPAGPAKAIMFELAAAANGANVSLQQQSDILYGGVKAREKAVNSIDAMNPQLKNMGDIAYDSSGKMRPLKDIIDLVTRGTKDMTQEDRNAAITKIFGADATRAILALMKGGLPTYEAQRKAIMQQGAAADFARAKNAGLGGAIDNVKSQFENAAISIYNQVKGPLTQGLNGIAAALPGIFAGIGQFSSFIGQNIDVIRDWGVAIGAVTLALKLNSAMLAVNAAGGILAYIKGIQIVSGATRLWAGAQALLNASLLANPIGVAIVAITALIAIVVLAYRHSETFRSIVQAVWSAIKTAIKATVDWIVGTAWPAIKAALDGIGAAALWLWRNAFVPAFNAIKAVVVGAINIVKAIIGGLVTAFQAVAAVAVWLWRNVFAPVWAGISKVVQIAWLIIEIIFKALTNYLRNVIAPAINFLWRNVFAPAFNAIKLLISAWWLASKQVFGLFVTYVVGPLRTALTATKNFFVGIFNAIKSTIASWYSSGVKPAFDKVTLAWRAVSTAFSVVYNNTIKPLFQRFIDFIRNNVVKTFETAVSAIGKAWDKVKEVARKPVAFVVNQVINPFIRGLNKAASVVGVKDRVSEVAGFANGGQVGHAAGGKIGGAGAFTDNKQAVIPGRGAVQLMGGEFIVNRRDTAKALPLLRWVNAGMRGGAQEIARYLGKPVADRPGDGSEGWAFKDGGLVGWVKDVWGAVSNPGETIKKPFEALLNKIPGAGTIKDFLVGGAKRMLNGAVSWLTSFGGMGGGGGNAGGNVGKAQAFVRAQAGKPYGWNNAGPGSYDCSGIVSAAYNILKGNNPYAHTFSTGSLPGPWFAEGKANSPLIAGWAHPGQRGASANVGHMAGMVGGLSFESTGSRGVHVNSGRRPNDFAHVGAARFADGGLFGKPIRLFDNGGAWPTGTLGMNLSGRTEHVDPNPGRTNADIAERLDRMIALLEQNPGQVADALASPVRRTVSRSRAGGR